MTKYCSKCGKPSSDDIVYCPDCGTKLDDPVSDYNPKYLNKKEITIASIGALILSFVLPIMGFVISLGVIINTINNTSIVEKKGYIILGIVGIIISIAMLVLY